MPAEPKTKPTDVPVSVFIAAVENDFGIARLALNQPHCCRASAIAQLSACSLSTASSMALNKPNRLRFRPIDWKQTKRM